MDNTDIEETKARHQLPRRAQDVIWLEMSLDNAKEILEITQDIAYMLPNQPLAQESEKDIQQYVHDIRKKIAEAIGV